MKKLKDIGVANLMTIFRIICIPIFIFFFALKQYGVALVIFSLAAYTDLIDGTVARLRKEKSELGAMLDPFADKGLMLATFIALAIAEVVPIWFIYIILIRDIIVVSGWILFKIRKYDIKITAIWSSKIATLLEILTGVIALVYLTYPASTIWVYPVGDLVYGSVLITSVLILIATMQYLKRGLEMLESRGSISLKRLRRGRKEKTAASKTNSTEKES